MRASSLSAAHVEKLGSEKRPCAGAGSAHAGAGGGASQRRPVKPGRIAKWALVAAMVAMLEPCAALPQPSDSPGQWRRGTGRCNDAMALLRRSCANRLRLKGGGAILARQPSIDSVVADAAVASLFARPQSIQGWADLLTSMFPLWVGVAVLLGLSRPETVTWLSDDGVTVGVGATMVFTGMTLSTQEFVRVLQRPTSVAMGCMCQYTLMPMAAFLIGHLMRLPKDVRAGLILLGSCPGGTSRHKF